MNVIFIHRQNGRARQLNLAHPAALAGVSAVLLTLMSAAFFVGRALGVSAGEERPTAQMAQWGERLAAHICTLPD